MSNVDAITQFQAANMAVFTAICRALIDSRAVDSTILVSHLEDLSAAAMASELSPGAQAVVIEQLLKDVKAYAARRSGGSADPN